MDFAFLKVSAGAIYCGWGGFAGASRPPGSGAAFYVNDFSLSDPEPWKTPEHFAKVASIGEAIPGLNGHLPLVVWDELRSDGFDRVFSDIQSDIADGRIKKSVPVITERGRVTRGKPANLAERVAALERPLFSYGYVEGNDGFLGATPEELFALEGSRLRTMALAGTAPVAEEKRFSIDAKEIEEHELVAQHLIQQLADLGEVTRHARECLELGPIVHFLTPIEVALERPRKIEGLIHRMHPTPALGSFPRTMESLKKLYEYRALLQAPERFGAPFGVLADGEFHSIVMIRNISWEGDAIFLPSGCGVIEDSTRENEWLELALKRRAVKELLGF